MGRTMCVGRVLGFFESFPFFQIGRKPWAFVGPVALTHVCVFWSDLRTPIRVSLIVVPDTISAVYLTDNPVHHGRTKHIELDVHFVREKVAIGDLRVRHVPTKMQIADIMTRVSPRRCSRTSGPVCASQTTIKLRGV